MNPMTNLLLDTLMKFGFVIVLAFLIRSVVKGDFRLDPNHRYAEAQVHAYGVANQYHHWKGTDGIAYLHEACKDEYQAEEAQLYQFFEVWLDEADTEHSCEWCE